MPPATYPLDGTWYQRYTPLDRMTHTCENTTFPQLLLRTVKMKKYQGVTGHSGGSHVNHSSTSHQWKTHVTRQCLERLVILMRVVYRVELNDVKYTTSRWRHVHRDGSIVCLLITLTSLIGRKYLPKVKIMKYNHKYEYERMQGYFILYLKSCVCLLRVLCLCTTHHSRLVFCVHCTLCIGLCWYRTNWKENHPSLVGQSPSPLSFWTFLLGNEMNLTEV